MTCPQCGAALVDPAGWPAWCDACNWGVDPQPRQQPETLFVRWWQRRLDAAVRAEHAVVTGQPDTVHRRHGLTAVAFAAAVGIHVVTLGLVFAAVVAVLSGIALVLKIAISAVCVGIALVVAPRPWRHGRKLTGWARSDAPHVFMLLDAVAAAVGGEAPARVVVTDEFSTAVAGSGRRRTLLIGLPLWRALGADERVAMLAHHLSAAAGRDARRSVLVRTARQSVHDWLGLSRPSEMEERVAARRRRRLPRRFSSDFKVSDALIPVGLSPFYAVVLPLGAAMRLSGLRCGHRATYAADAVAASVAGSAATRGWLDVSLMAEAIEASMSLALRRDPGSDLLAVAAAYPGRLPDRERRRLRKRDELRAEGGGGDEPPLSFRIGLIPGQEPSQRVIGPALIDGADLELTRAEPDVRRELRTRLADSGL